MKKIFLTLALTLFVLASNAQTKSFGAKITPDGAITTQQLQDQLKGKDSLRTKVTATVISVCQKKGCWMKVNMPNGGDLMVRFKNYGFFMPLDLPAGSTVVMDGLAYSETISVDMLRHYAEDAGKSKKEIKKIKKPETRLSFTADGVIIL